MVQTLILIVLFAGAVLYLGRLVYRAFRPATAGCAGECKCESKVQVTPRP